MSTPILLAGVIACMFLSFLFSGMETGIILLNRARIRHLKEIGSFGAGVLLDFLHHPGRLSSTVLVGNTVVNAAATVLVVEIFLKHGGPAAAVVAVFLFALVLWIFGDLVPKALFRKYPNRLSTRFAPLLWMTYVCLWPLVRLFDFLTQAVVAVMGGGVSQRQMFVTRDELKLMARELGENDTFSGEQRNLLGSILDCHHATARDVMRPLPEVITVTPSQSETERRAVAITSGFSRLPVISENPNPHHPWDGLWIVYDGFFLEKSKSRSKGNEFSKK